MIETRTIEFDRLNVSLRILLAISMLGIGIWLAFADTNILSKIPKLDDANLRKFMGYVILILATGGIVFLLKCLITNKPGFIADESGVYFRNTIFPKEIAWSEIKSIEKFDLKFFFLNWPVLKIVLKYSDSQKIVSPFLLKISLAEFTQMLEEDFKKTTANSGFTQ